MKNYNQTQNYKGKQIGESPVFIAKPTNKQLEWQELELGVLIHYILNIYRPDMSDQDWKKVSVRWEIAPEKINPPRLSPEQWVRSAWEMGAKYAILVAKHGTGFSLWPTKEHDYSVASMPWKNGKGDIVREFIDACKKYDLKPGLYYHPTCNGYYGVNNKKTYDYKGEWYQTYLRHVEAQVKELWSEYGELFEIWFDGGILPPEDGGLDLEPILYKYQPNAITFQGPRNHPHNLRWVGNEDGLAPENCWATTNAGDVRYDGTFSVEKAGVGDPDGKYYWPAETDMPNRTHAAFDGGWGWAVNEEHLIYKPEELLDCYVRSVGRNSNLLLGMAISVDGDFQDEEQFRQFGDLIRNTFSDPVAILTDPVPEQDTDFVLEIPKNHSVSYLVIREMIVDGQHIRGFQVLADEQVIYESQCIGHKRIVPLKGIQLQKLTLRITVAAEGWSLRDIAVY